MKPDLVDFGGYEKREQYEKKFSEVYRSSTIVDMRGMKIIFGVVNGERDWAHVCFGLEGMAALSEDLWKPERAARILWIKTALQDGSRTTIHYSPTHKDRRLYYFCTGDRENLDAECEYFLVVTEVENAKSLKFITAYNITKEDFVMATNRLPKEWQTKGRKKPKK